MEKQIASFSQKAVSAITGPASQFGEIISEGGKRGNEVIEEIRQGTENFLNNLTAGIENNVVKKEVEVPLINHSTPPLETPTQQSESSNSVASDTNLPDSNSVVSDTNPPDSNSVISNETSSSILSGTRRILSILTRISSRSSSNKSLSNLSSSRHSDSDGSINSRDNPKSNLAQSSVSTISDYSISNIGSLFFGMFYTLGNLLRLIGSARLIPEKDNNQIHKISLHAKEKNKTRIPHEEIHKSSGGPWMWLSLKAWFNDHQVKKEIPISSPRLGTSDDWSSYLSSSIYSAQYSISDFGKWSSKKISTLSEKMTSRKESSNYSFTALSSGSGALYKYTKSGLRNVASSIQTAGSSIAQISQYQSSSSWGDLPQIDLSNLTRSASNSVSGASRSLRGVDLGSGIGRASSWAGGVARRGSGFIERQRTTQHPINFSQTASDGWASMVSGVSNIRRSLPDIGASISFER